MGHTAIAGGGIAPDQDLLGVHLLANALQMQGHIGETNWRLANIDLPVFINRDLNGVVVFLNSAALSKGRAVHWKAPHDRAVHQGRQEQQNDQKDGVEHGGQVRTARPDRI